LSRKLKKTISEKLASDTPEAVCSLLENIPPRQAVTPLISALYSQDHRIRWNAITALATVLARMARDDMEHARTVMRRFIWSLNDESGGIGWGAAETMAEAMVLHEGLYNEYARILLSFIREDGNYLEYPPLRRGALWGIGRLGHVRPELLRKVGARRWLCDYLKDRDAQSRAFAARALGSLGDEQDAAALEKLVEQTDTVEIYMDGGLRHFTVGEIARTALAELSRDMT
jgi:HEAT repeat protein